MKIFMDALTHPIDTFKETFFGSSFIDVIDRKQEVAQEEFDALTKEQQSCVNRLYRDLHGIL